MKYQKKATYEALLKQEKLKFGYESKGIEFRKHKLSFSVVESTSLVAICHLSDTGAKKNKKMIKEEAVI